MSTHSTRTPGGRLFTRPPFAAVFLSLASVVVAIFLLVTPSAEGFVAEVAPHYYARVTLRDARYFMGPNSSDEVGIMQRPVVSWRYLAATPNAAPVFEDFASNGSAAGRLYGLAGLLLTDSARARPVLERLLRDTSRVEFVSPCEYAVDSSVAGLAAAVSAPGWVQAMRDSIARCPREALAPAG